MGQARFYCLFQLSHLRIEQIAMSQQLSQEQDVVVVEMPLKGETQLPDLAAPTGASQLSQSNRVGLPLKQSFDHLARAFAQDLSDNRG